MTHPLYDIRCGKHSATGSSADCWWGYHSTSALEDAKQARNLGDRQPWMETALPLWAELLAGQRQRLRGGPVRVICASYEPGFRIEPAGRMERTQARRRDVRAPLGRDDFG
jgi:hypothetical protein